MTNHRLQLAPLLKVVIALILGMAVGDCQQFYLPSSVWAFLVILFLVVALAVKRWYICQSLMILLSIFAVGGWLMKNAEESLIKVLPENELEYEAVVVTEPVKHGKVIQCDMLILNGKNPIKSRATILCDTIYKKYENLHVGDGIIAFSLLQKPYNLQNSTFDYARWLNLHGYLAQTFIYYKNWDKAEVPLTSLSLTERTKLAALKFRKKLVDHLHGMGLTGQELAVVSAMALGDKSLLPKKLKEEFSIAGASHVLALSGLHLAILYTMLSWIFFRWRFQWLSELMLIASIWSYVVLVGMSSSVVRTAIMLTIYSIVGLLNRNRMSVNTLALSAILMLVANPFCLYDVGFQLSYTAVLAIFLFTPLLYPLVGTCFLRNNYFLKWIWGTVVVSVAAQLGTAPLVAFYFGRFSVYFILTNLVVITCVMVILYTFVILVLGMFLPVVLQNMIA